MTAATKTAAITVTVIRKRVRKEAERDQRKRRMGRESNTV
jgi:hypothetical protein